MRSVPSVPPPQSSAQPGAAPTVDPNSPEYLATLNRLKEYSDHCKRLISRLEVDLEYQRRLRSENAQEAKLLTSVRRVVEIMDGKRVVDIKLLERLINNVKSSLTSNNPSKGLYDIGRRLATGERVHPVKNTLPDAWSSLRHLEIRFPEVASKRTQAVVTEETNGSDSKILGPAPHKGEDMEDGLAGDPPPKKSKNSSGEDGSMPSREEGGNEISGLNEQLSTEIETLDLPCRLDGDFQPVNRETCSTIPLLIEYDNKLGHNFIVAPLRLLVPFSYPLGVIHLSPVQPAGTMNQEVNRELRARLDSDDPTRPGNVASIVELWLKLIKKASSAPAKLIRQ